MYFNKCTCTCKHKKKILKSKHNRKNSASPEEIVRTMLAGAVLVGTVLVGTMLVGTVLVGTMLVGTVLVGTLLVGTVLLGTLLVGTLLVGILLEVITDLEIHKFSTCHDTKSMCSFFTCIATFHANLSSCSYLKQVYNLGSRYSCSPQKCPHISGCIVHCSLHTH